MNDSRCLVDIYYIYVYETDLKTRSGSISIITLINCFFAITNLTFCGQNLQTRYKTDKHSYEIFPADICKISGGTGGQQGQGNIPNID